MLGGAVAAMGGQIVLEEVVAQIVTYNVGRSAEGFIESTISGLGGGRSTIASGFRNDLVLLNNYAF